MRAQVVAIHSGAEYTDGERRIELSVLEADAMFRRLRIPERLISLVTLHLDDEIQLEVLFNPPAVTPTPRASGVDNIVTAGQKAWTRRHES